MVPNTPENWHEGYQWLKKWAIGDSTSHCGLKAETQLWNLLTAFTWITKPVSSSETRQESRWERGFPTASVPCLTNSHSLSWGSQTEVASPPSRCSAKCKEWSEQGHASSYQKLRVKVGRDQFQHEINIRGFAAQWSLKDQMHLNEKKSGFINAESPAASSDWGCFFLFSILPCF